MYIQTNYPFYDARPSTDSQFYSPVAISSVDERIARAAAGYIHSLNADANFFYPQTFQNLDIRSLNSGKITVETYLKEHSHEDLCIIAPHLTKVVVGNAAVERLPDFPSCKVFICRNNNALKEVPDLPLCETFVCTGCSSVESLPSSLTACRQFDCSDCPKVEELPDLPLAQTIECRHCAKMVFPPTKLESCLKFDCRGCTNLNQLPEMPKCVSLLFKGTALGRRILVRPGVEFSQEGKLYLAINWAELTAQPESILITLSDCVRLNRKFPLISFVHETQASTAIDMGGPSRQLLTILFERLCGPTPKLSCFSLNQGKILPTAANEVEYNNWRAVGCLLRIALKKEWTIGAQFDEGFFGGLSYLLCNKLWGSEFLISLNPTYTFCRDALKGRLPSEADKEKLRCFIAVDRDEDVETYQLPEDPQELQSIMLEAFKNLGDESHSGVPYRDIFKGLQAVKEGFWSFGSPAAFEAEQLQNKIQGVLTKELIKNSLVFQRFKHNQNHVKRLLPAWVDQQEMPTLATFLEVVTGSRTLSSTTKIRIQCVRDNTKLLPVAHTCFKQLDMPPYTSKKLLAMRLKTFMEQAMAGTGFQIA